MKGVIDVEPDPALAAIKTYRYLRKLEHRLQICGLGLEVAQQRFELFHS